MIIIQDKPQINQCSRLTMTVSGLRGVSSGDWRSTKLIGIVGHKQCLLSEWLLNIRVASLNRAFASSVAFVPESTAERNARSHIRRILQENVRTKRLKPGMVGDLLSSASSCASFGGARRERSWHIEINSMA